ncbi:MAG: c-type cytochrome biogenesis protein CcmI [Ectothiorhodospiraceae bacterium]|nr:c-type cytochrome biogenesis protein CcmI [Ectothiorhodospiraceae bacterium]
MTPAFWIAAGILLLGAALLITLPLLRGNARAAVEQRRLNISIYRQRMAELEEELENNLLTADQLEAARRELEQNLLHDVDGVEREDTRRPGRQGRATLVATALLLPVMALGAHGFLYQPPPGAAEQLLMSGRAADDGYKLADIERMVERLSQRLESEPDSVGGWVMLGRSYTHLERYPEASDAYSRALELHGDEPNLLAEYAQALILAGDGRIGDRAHELTQRALELDPTNGNALWIAGVSAYQRGDYDQAAEHWETLLYHLPEGSEAALMARNALAEAFALSGLATDQAPRPAR